jgi:hypothetical protein
VLQHVVTLERLDEEESQGRHPLHDASRAELFLLQEIALKSSDVVWPQLIGRPVEIG